MIKTAIFDLDGTIADTITDLGKAMNRMLSHFGYPERDMEQIREAICYGQREFVKRSLPASAAKDGETVDKCQKYYAERYNECYNDSTFPYEGVTDVLAFLAKKGIKLAVVTNKAHDHALKVLSKCYPGISFDVIIGNKPGIPAKPDPTGALSAAEITGASASECVFIGDSDVDILTGKNAGMKTVGVCWGYRDQALLISSGADLIARNASELCGILLSL